MPFDEVCTTCVVLDDDFAAALIPREKEERDEVGDVLRQPLHEREKQSRLSPTREGFLGFLASPAANERATGDDILA